MTYSDESHNNHPDGVSWRRRRQRQVRPGLASISVLPFFMMSPVAGMAFPTKTTFTTISPQLSLLTNQRCRFSGTRQHGLQRYLPSRRESLVPCWSSGISFPHSNLDVAIDQPIIPDSLFSMPPPELRLPSPGNVFRVNTVGQLLLRFIASDVFKYTIYAFGAAFFLSLMAQSTKPVASTIGNFFKMVQGRVHRVLDHFQREQVAGVPMPFEKNGSSQGWGVCTLRSKRRLGRTSYVQYEFDLPEPDYVLPLELGQEISLCCLDNENNVAKGEFFPYSTDSRPKPGTFSILVPNRSPHDMEYAIGDEAANFICVLKEDMKVGDEIAIKPGDRKLSYRGQYLPVTEMVYIAVGAGIVPVLEQVRSVLPSGTSSVKSVSVVWVNEDTRDFDVNAELLEREYFKYSAKLAVACIVDDIRAKSLEDNAEIDAAVPNFSPGTMAVLSGPRELMKKAAAYLIDRGYPKDCLCVL